ncbi:hypothetical protein KIN20_028651 [Parelaphostrongylus tenuis]|uniref:Uncharacterized protein n=1 Tax=Parelaphostrongylus tenuis TaxID=148309 RepID=A0AAD5WF87_PARTN|nr:hypothetical protein KIN20_028646 [Parelaphostrongylus tenuis]KAJ1367692.1 hypothetical protein KIN20_028651 [Parelaphostrongylus tenuis]
MHGHSISGRRDYFLSLGAPVRSVSERSPASGEIFGEFHNGLHSQVRLTKSSYSLKLLVGSTTYGICASPPVLSK